MKQFNVGWLRKSVPGFLWRGGPLISRLVALSMTVAMLTLVVRSTAALKDMTIAAQFGVSVYVDAFLLACVLPNFLINVITGPFSSTFIPIYIRIYSQEGRAAGQHLLSGVSGFVLILACATMAILALLGPALISLISSHLSPAEADLIRKLFYLLLPTILLSSLSLFGEGLLSAHRAYSAASVAPILLPAGVIVLLLSCTRFLGIYSAAFGTLVGYALELAFVGWRLSKIDISLRPHWQGKSLQINSVIRQYFPLVCGSLIGYGSVMIDQSMAVTLGKGSVAALNYGGRIASLCLSLASAAMTTVLLPHFAELASQQKWQELAQLFYSYLRLLLVVSVPAILILMYYSHPLVRLIFEHGVFTASDSILVAKVQALLLLQVPFQISGILGVRLLASMEEGRIIMWSGISNFFVNILGNYLLMQWLGVLGIALATAIVYLLSMIYLLVAVRVKLQRKLIADPVSERRSDG